MEAAETGLAAAVAAAVGPRAQETAAAAARMPAGTRLPSRGAGRASMSGACSEWLCAKLFVSYVYAHLDGLLQGAGHCMDDSVQHFQ